MTGKRLRNSYKSIDRDKVYALSEAVKIIRQNATSKFDETIDLAMNLSVDSRKADQNVRGVLQLPHGTGKTYRVAVFAKDAKAKEAQEAGADIVGAEDLLQQIQKGELNFDRCIATPDMMGVVGRVAKILGPRGLMPNPKLGTVTNDIKLAVQAVKGGQVEYRAEKGGIIHSGVGKASFSDSQLEENIRSFVETVLKARPSGVKGTFLKKLTLSSTMGPGVTFEL